MPCVQILEYVVCINWSACVISNVVYLCCFIRRHFEVVDPSDVKDAAKLFSVPDFVGDACKAIASRVRGAVAGVQFDDFHKVCLSVCVFVSVCVCVCMYVCSYMMCDE